MDKEKMWDIIHLVAKISAIVATISGVLFVLSWGKQLGFLGDAVLYIYLLSFVIAVLFGGIHHILAFILRSFGKCFAVASAFGGVVIGATVALFALIPLAFVILFLPIIPLRWTNPNAV